MNLEIAECEDCLSTTKHNCFTSSAVQQELVCKKCRNIKIPILHYLFTQKQPICKYCGTEILGLDHIIFCSKIPHIELSNWTKSDCICHLLYHILYENTSYTTST